MKSNPAMAISKISGAVAILGCLTTQLSGEDWPRFRGPQGTGVSSQRNLPVNLNAEKHLRWAVDLPGRGLSAPIIVGDRLFLTASSGPDQNRLHILCLDANDGSQRWERKFWATGRTMCHNKTSVAAPTPVSDGQRVFALFSSNDLFCLDLEGNLLWLRGLTHDYPNASNSLGMSSSPIVIDDTLIVQIENDAESFAAGLDVRTGRNLWKLDRPKAANWTSPLTITDPATGRELPILQSSKGALCVDPSSGRAVWDYGDGASTIPSGAVHDGAVYLVSHGITALRPSPEADDPEQLWRSNRLRPATASPIILGDYIFTVNNAGVLTCGNVHTGERIWQLRMKGPFSASPVAAGRHLYLFNEDGLGQVIDIDAPEGEIVGELDLGETILGTPAIAHDGLYVRSDDHLWKIAKEPIL